MLPEMAAENWNEGASIRLRGADWRTAVFGRRMTEYWTRGQQKISVRQEDHRIFDNHGGQNVIRDKRMDMGERYAIFEFLFNSDRKKRVLQYSRR